MAGPGGPENGAIRRARRRRANGEGSIWLRKDGRYGYAAYVLTTAGTIKRIQGYAHSHDDARKLLTELIAKADQGIPVASESWTVAEYLTYWLRLIVREDRRPKTYQGYEGVVRLHLIPGIGKKRLAKLTAQDVRAFITRTRQECQCCKHGWDAQRDNPRCCARQAGQCCQSRLSARMVQSIHAVLRNALESAVREEIIPRNVAKLVQVPAPRYKINRGLTTQQARATLKAAAEYRLAALYVLALFLGLRRGELLGLRWEDADLDRATLEVVQTLQRVGGRCVSFLPRPRIHGGRFRFPRSAWKLCASIGNGSSPTAPKHCQTGKIMGSSSRRAAERRLNPTTSAGAGTPSARRPGSARRGFMIFVIPA